MILFSHPSPTEPVRHTACALRRARVLREFWVLSNGRPKLVFPAVQQAAPAPVPLQAGAPDCGMELRAAAGEHPAFSEVCDRAPDQRALESLDRFLCTRVQRGKFDAVYAYEGGAEATFRVAAEVGTLRMYDLPRGYRRGPNAILAEEALAEPEWAVTLNCPGRAPAIAEAELYDADVVFVASSLGLQTIEGMSDVPGAVAIIPPGAPSPTPAAATAARRAGAVDHLRVLYVGTLSQRGGLSYGFQACRQLGSAVTLTVAGPAPAVSCPALERELVRARWVPTQSLPIIDREMTNHDVLLLPAVFDTGTDIPLRALAAGLPIVTTPNAAAADFVRDGHEGFVVPIRSATALAAKLDLLRRDPDLRASMSLSALRRATAWSWPRYDATLGATLLTALTPRGQPALV